MRCTISRAIHSNGKQRLPKYALAPCCLPAACFPLDVVDIVEYYHLLEDAALQFHNLVGGQH